VGPEVEYEMQADDFETARFNMVAQQIRPWEVIDERVLDVLQTIPRERFVDPEYVGLAFADVAVPLGEEPVDDETRSGGPHAAGPERTAR
jgi:protein-L-isoaspartate O-methyltransferase